MNGESIAQCYVGPSKWECPVDNCKQILSRKQTLTCHLTNIHGIDVLVPRRKYKEYEYDTSKEVPKQTLSNKRRKLEESNCVADQADIDADIETSTRSDVLVPDDFSNNSTTNGESDVEFDSDMEISSTDESSDEFENLFDSEEESDSKLPTSVSDHLQISSTENIHVIPSSKVPLYVLPVAKEKFEPISYDDHVLAVGTYVTRHNLSDTAFEHLLSLIDIHIPENNLIEKNINKVKANYGFYENFLKFHTFCSICENIFSNGLDSCQTPTCPGRKQTNRTQNYFVTGNLQKQLSDILSRNGIWEDIQGKADASVQTVTDIVDGCEYKKLTVEGQFLSSKNNISLTLFTDGIPLFKSSGVSLWPVYLLINEISRKQRFLKKNMVLWGVWQGTGKPNMSIFLKSLVLDLQNLYTKGTPVFIQGEEITCRAMLAVATMDLQARAAVLNMTQHNGERSCVYCTEPGITVKSGKGHCRCFPYKSFTLRSPADVLQDGRRAQESRRRVNGFLGESVFNFVPGFDLTNNIVVDYMHGILLGISKKLLMLWFNGTSFNKPYFIGQHIKEMDRLMKKITPPYLINRMPRKLSNTMHHWKASELRAWLLYYSLPCLLGVLSNVYLVHFSTLVEGTCILLGEGLTDADLHRADMLFHAFARNAEALYGQNFMGLNVHNLLHIVNCVKKWGPIWAWSCFSFESFNGEIKKSVHGTGNVCRQIFWSLQAQKHIENISYQNCEERTRDFVNKLVSGKIASENNSVIAYQCTVLNVKEVTSNLKFFDEIKPVLFDLTSSESSSDFLRASKIIRNGLVFYSKLCTKVKKRNSYTAALVRSEHFIEIEYFLLHKVSLHVYVVSRKLIIADGVLPNRVPHIKEIKVDSGNAVLEKAEHLHDLLVNIPVGKRTFVAVMPNTIERS